jgi:hypothetical protein
VGRTREAAVACDIGLAKDANSGERTKTDETDAKANRLNRQRLARKRLKCSGFPKALKDSHSLRHLRSLALARWRFEWLSGIAPLANDVS